jgi:hypothetical protein
MASKKIRMSKVYFRHSFRQSDFRRSDPFQIFRLSTFSFRLLTFLFSTLWPFPLYFTCKEKLTTFLHQLSCFWSSLNKSIKNSSFNFSAKSIELVLDWELVSYINWYFSRILVSSYKSKFLAKNNLVILTIFHLIYRPKLGNFYLAKYTNKIF